MPDLSGIDSYKEIASDIDEEEPLSGSESTESRIKNGPNSNSKLESETNNGR